MPFCLKHLVLNAPPLHYPEPSSLRLQTVRQEDGECLFRPPFLAGLMPRTQERWTWHAGSHPPRLTGHTHTFHPGCGFLYSMVCALAFWYSSIFPFLPSCPHLMPLSHQVSSTPPQPLPQAQPSPTCSLLSSSNPKTALQSPSYPTSTSTQIYLSPSHYPVFHTACTSDPFNFTSHRQNIAKSPELC